MVPMTINDYACGSCAVADMRNVAGCTSPVDVLVKFCKTQLGTPNTFNSAYMKLTNFYIFCAGPEVKSGEPGGTGHSKDHWPRYGTELAAYITEHGLGQIATLGPKKNAKHHPTSTAQLWMWSPDQQAVEQWWKDYQQGLI